MVRAIQTESMSDADRVQTRRAFGGVPPPPRACVGGTRLRRSWGGPYGNVTAVVAAEADGDGCREAMGAAEGFTKFLGEPPAEVSRSARCMIVRGRRRCRHGRLNHQDAPEGGVPGAHRTHAAKC